VVAPLPRVRAAKVLRLFCIGLVFAYPFNAHFSALKGRPEWAVMLMLVLAGVILRSAIAAWPTWVLAFTAIAGAVLLAPPQGVLYLSPILINLALAAVVGASLRAGAEPFISRFARLERGEPLDACLATYSRRLTQVWTVFFAAMAIVSTALAAFAPLYVWSLFTNGFAYVLIATLFLGEWLYRRICLSEYRHAPPWTVVRIVAQAGITPRAGTPNA
jgi:uncharacterized membrane protein